MTNELYARITTSLIDGDPDLTATLTEQALSAGAAPLEIIEQALTPGMRTVGEKFSCGEVFIPNLIMAARGMKRAMEHIEPELRRRQLSVRSAGVVVLGTVKGDIHEIGKSLVGIMLSASGFEVHDLGVDVPIESFVRTVETTHANLVGLSSLLTTTMGVQRKVIEALVSAGLRSSVRVMVGGAPVTDKWAKEIGADGYAEDAVGAVDLALRLSGRP